MGDEATRLEKLECPQPRATRLRSRTERATGLHDERVVDTRHQWRRGRRVVLALGCLQYRRDRSTRRLGGGGRSTHPAEKVAFEDGGLVAGVLRDTHAPHEGSCS